MRGRWLCFLLVFIMVLTACTPVSKVNETESAKQEDHVMPGQSGQLTEPVASGETTEETQDQAPEGNPAVEQSAQQEASEAALHIYVPNETYTDLVREPVEEDIQDVRYLVALLVRHNVLPEGTAILSLEIRDSGGAFPQTEDSTKYVVGTRWIELDMTGQFLQAFDDVSREQEELIMASLTNTLLEYYGMTELTILCEGEHIETAHNYYDFDLTFRDVT